MLVGDYERAMVEETLRRVEHLPDSAAARRVGFRTPATIIRWRKGEIPPLRSARQIIETFLGVAGFDADQMKAVVAEWAAKAATTSKPVLVVRNGS